MSSDKLKSKKVLLKKIEGFVMLDKNSHYDDNDRPMALIKISTENIGRDRMAANVR